MDQEEDQEQAQEAAQEEDHHPQEGTKATRLEGEVATPLRLTTVAHLEAKQDQEKAQSTPPDREVSQVPELVFQEDQSANREGEGETQ